MPRRQNFTLIEILTVIGIAVVLMALVIPSFSSFSSGRAPGALGSQLRGVLMQAQGTAVTNRKHTALLLDLDGSCRSSTDKRGRQAYRLCYVRPQGTTFDFQEWIPGEDWRELPAGALIAAIDAGSSVPGTVTLPTNGTGTVSDSKLPKIQNLRPASHGETKDTRPALVFSPLGGLASPTSNAYLFVVEGRLADGNVQYLSGYNIYKDLTNKVGLEINQFTGQADYL